jgi:4-hydroxybenzoate polyprenyltransferase
MPFALVGYFLAIELDDAFFDWTLLIKIVACMVFGRNAAMAFNRYADRHIDKVNPRTFIREIPSGVISPGSALIFILINVGLFIYTTFLINQICFYLSPVALLVILGYSYTKRFTPLCHLVLGAGLALAPIGAYLAASGHFAPVPLLFSFAVLFWVSGFDIIYALQDMNFDKQQGLKSIPVMLGAKNALLLSRFIHLLTSISLLIPGWIIPGGNFYFIGWALFSFLLIYQHSLVKVDDLSKINLAFFTTNGIASVLFATFFMLDYWAK